jgi:hypothetical protein
MATTKEDYVSFEIAKLLKEKGFKGFTMFSYSNRGTTMCGHWENEIDWLPKCTLQMAMKWLREVHKLDIDVSIEYKNSKKVYYYSILKKTVIRNIDCLHSETNFDSYEQAAESAIKYCLENLI